MSEQQEKRRKNKAFARTDMGAAKWLAQEFVGELRYCAEIGWMKWTGTRWMSEPAAGVQTMQRLVRIIYKYAADIADPVLRREVIDFAGSCESASRCRAVLFHAQALTSLYTHLDDFDADPWLFNTVTGTIDLRNCILRDHNPRDLLTKISPAAYAPEADAPIFKKFLTEIFGGDDNLIIYLRRMLGMCLTGDISEQYLWFWHGVGANGKSTLADLIAFVMGDYAGQASETLIVTGKQREHPTELADLQGRRLVFASETEQNAALTIQRIKRLTGDATIKARRMKKDFSEFPRTHKTIVQTNNKPRVREDSEAVWRRMKLVPFNVVIPEGKRDKMLLEKLKAEAPGVLAWLVRGCRAWRKHGLYEPDAVRNATSAFREESNPIGDFVAERCRLRAGGQVTKGRLYEKYVEYANAANDGDPLTKRAFGQAIAKLSGVIEDRKKSGRLWIGIVLNGDT